MIRTANFENAYQAAQAALAELDAMHHDNTESDDEDPEVAWDVFSQTYEAAWDAREAAYDTLIAFYYAN